MLNENAKKWVEALRSGKYKQGRHSLRDGNAFCCLGVACDLYAQDFQHPGWNCHPLSGWSFEGEAGILPVGVSNWLGLVDRAGAWKSNAQLSSKNDRGASFAEIADIIESEPEGLFA